MGIIQKQTLRGTFYSYLGVLVGFVTTGLLFPKFLSTDEIGLLNLLISFSVLFAQLASLGFNGVINRLFPYFRKEQKGHNGFLLIALLVTIFGFLITFGVFEIIKPSLIRNNIENSALLVDYINYIIPLLFFTLFFNLFDSYNKAIYDAVLGTFLKEFAQRILILLALLFYVFNLIDIHLFVQLYVVAISSPALIILFILLFRGEFRIQKPNKDIFTKGIIREMINLCANGVISGFGNIAILQIDRILVNKFLGLSLTGIYSTNYFFATLIVIPSRSLIKISTTIIADSWKKNDLANILLIYKKSVINQGIIGLLIFAGLWINIHNIYQILPPEFSEGKWVIFFVGIANVITMSSGVSGIIISTSQHYKIHTYFILIYLGLIVGLNFILIPEFGIMGSAITFLISTLAFNLMRYGYVLYKFKMNPYNYRFLVLLVISAISCLIASLIPHFENIYLDIIIRSSAMMILFIPPIYFFSISSDVNSSLDTVLRILKIKKR